MTTAISLDKIHRAAKIVNERARRTAIPRESIVFDILQDRFRVVVLRNGPIENTGPIVEITFDAAERMSLEEMASALGEYACLKAEPGMVRRR